MNQTAKKRNHIVQPVPDPAKTMLTRNEAAGTLSVSLRTLQKLVAAGKIRAKRVGSRLLIPRTEIDKFVKAGDVDVIEAAGARQ